MAWIKIVAPEAATGALKKEYQAAVERADDLQPLRELGFDDQGILEAVQITGFFNCINRVADARGVDFGAGS